MRDRARSTVLALAVLASAACSSSTETTADRSLDGPWTNHTTGQGVALGLTLTWTSTTVSGSGTYNVLDQSTGCGGATLHGTGTVTFTATRTDSAISGSMKFDNGWTPAYRGILENGSAIDGAFLTVGPALCPMTLFRGLVP